jgi:hypothetical protein
MKTILALIAVLLSAALAAAPARADCTGIWMPHDGVSGSVEAMAVLPSGDLLVGGAFTAAGNIGATSIARYSPATNTWFSVGPGAYNNGSLADVYAMVVLPNGDVVVGGGFNSIGGIPAGYIARYSPASNTWSALGTGLDSAVQALAVLPNGDVIAGGQFNNAGTTPTPRIARWSAATSTWSAISASTNGSVVALAVLSSGDLVVGGGFTQINGLPAVCLARWNPTTGVWTSLNSGPFFTLRALAALPGGDAVVGGAFSSVGGVTAYGTARLNASTNAWSALGTPVVDSSEVWSLAVLPGGDVVAGGEFSTFAGVTAHSIARFSMASSSWSAFGSGVDAGPNPSTVLAIAPLANGDLFAGGNFLSAGGAPAGGVARWNAGAAAWSTLGAGITGTVNAMTTLSGGDVIVAGALTAVPGMPVNRIARWTPPTNAWSALGSGTSDTINALAVLGNGTIAAGGPFTSAGGGAAAHVAAWNPATSLWSPLGGGVDGTVYALLALPGGDLLVGGSFANAGGSPAQCVARWNTATASWSAIGSGFAATSPTAPVVLSLALMSNGDVAVGGTFTLAGGVAANNVARWNPTTGVWTAFGAGVNSPSPTVPGVGALAALPTGDLIVGGYFLNAGSTTARYLARWNAATSAWVLGPSPGIIIHAFGVLPDGEVVFSGQDSTSGQSTISRWNTVTNVLTVFGSIGSANAIVGLPSGDIIAGGTTLSRWIPTLQPVIYRQPVSVSVCRYLGGSLVMSVDNVGPVTYRWRIESPADSGQYVDLVPPVFTEAVSGMKVNFAVDSNSPAVSVSHLHLGNHPNAARFIGIVSNGCLTATSNPATVSLLPCMADFSCNGTLEVYDIFSFINAWFMADQRADFDEDGVIEVEDIFGFLNAWFAGC